MQPLKQKKLELSVIYTAIGKLPKINGSYLSNQKPQEHHSSQPHSNAKKITSIDLEWAKKRLQFQLKRLNEKKEGETHRNTQAHQNKQKIEENRSTKQDIARLPKENGHDITPEKNKLLSPPRLPPYHRLYRHRQLSSMVPSLPTYKHKLSLPSNSQSVHLPTNSQSVHLHHHLKIKFNRFSTDQAEPTQIVKTQPIQLKNDPHFKSQKIVSNLVEHRKNLILFNSQPKTQQQNNEFKKWNHNEPLRPKISTELDTNLPPLEPHDIRLDTKEEDKI